MVVERHYVACQGLALPRIPRLTIVTIPETELMCFIWGYLYEDYLAVVRKTPLELPICTDGLAAVGGANRIDRESPTRLF